MKVMQDISGVPSAAVHLPRMRIATSERADSISRSHRSFYFAKGSIMTVIVLAMLVIILFTLFWLIATPESVTKRSIDRLVYDYYENYFYPAILDSNSITPDTVPEHTDDINRIFDRYKDTGFSRLTLRQLFLYDNEKHISSASGISKYCDLDKTLLKIYPDSPYSATDFHVDYNYSCKF